MDDRLYAYLVQVGRFVLCRACAAAHAGRYTPRLTAISPPVYALAFQACHGHNGALPASTPTRLHTCPPPLLLPQHTREPSVLAELRAATAEQFATGARMQISPEQGAFMGWLVQVRSRCPGWRALHASGAC